MIVDKVNVLLSYLAASQCAWLSLAFSHVSKKSILPGSLSLRELMDHLGESGASKSPLLSSTLPWPTAVVFSGVVFCQKATQTRIHGLEALREACVQWDQDFGGSSADDQVCFTVERVSLLDGGTTSHQTVRMQWNVTWIPVSAAWLQHLPAKERVHVPYNHLSGIVRTFSWRAMGEVFTSYVRTGRIRIPLCCIQGVTDFHFQQRSDSKGESSWQVTRIEEDLVYAMDLQRGALQNRFCANDLRLFLEVARRSGKTTDIWYDTVATCLPWCAVPGSNPLGIDDTEEGPAAAVAYLGIVGTTLIVVASLLAPKLVG